MAKLPDAELAEMAVAGAQVLECYRVLQKTNSNVVAEVIKDGGTFYEYDHYPKGDVYDNETHSQYFYHAHRPKEHGHFHTFLRKDGMPRNCNPVKQSKAPFMDNRDDTISHIIGISMNRSGYPTRLFTTNRWITADNWYAADDVIKMLDRFHMDLAWPSWPVNIWLTAMLRLFRPQIIELVHERDAAARRWQESHPGVDVFEDRDFDIASVRRISVEAQIERVNVALHRVAA
ncbi:MAG: hypothetical protein HOM52_07670 [Rhodospirillaceae bacterium]|nr:hypothetical protein [Rhodospirillaceae bacterium]MBT3926325.1 hypothetical protein [Rhodospirillaceae bacterium]MBT5038374.1 hypothetical protein [Rhodospirillaceae bacterium]MBT5675070.1 hypothetical protein [Rhodospirillaceae bacterium]MBT5781298.1 hypothetical protein [Rhodospirillaceae bacterium]